MRWSARSREAGVFRVRRFAPFACLALVGCGFLDGAPPGVHAVITDEAAVRGRYGAHVRHLLEEGSFDEVEAIADSLRSHDSRWPSGASAMVTLLTRGFGEVEGGSRPAVWARHLGHLRAWVHKDPGSSIARLALAEGFVGRGLAARGTNWAHTVSPVEWQQLAGNLREAARILQSFSESDRSNPEWFEASLAVLGSAGPQADSAYRALAREAMRRFPDRHRFYVNMAIHLMPRWYGAPGDWESFADTSTKALPDSIADEFYARVVTNQSLFVENVFKDSQGLSWDRTKRGLEMASTLSGVAPITKRSGEARVPGG